MGVVIRGVIPITVKMAPKKKNLGSNEGDIKGGKMSSRVLG